MGDSLADSFSGKLILVGLFPISLIDLFSYRNMVVFSLVGMFLPIIIELT